MTLTITPSVVPTGGAIILDFMLDSRLSAESPMTLSRAVSTDGVLSAFTQLYTGNAVALFIDVGDGLPKPLGAGTAYVYEVTDASGSTVRTDPVLPTGAILIEPDGMTALLIRLLQAGVTNMTLLPGIAPANVSNAMPITGFPILPFVVVNLDLIQQENVPIGQNTEQPDGNNVWTVASYAKRIWRVSVLARTAAERDFYRDGLIAIFQSLLGSVFSALGSNMSHRFQAASGQTSDEYQGKSPGFYFADIMMEVLGVFNTSIETSFGLIETIITNAGLPDGQVDQTEVGAAARRYLVDSLGNPILDASSNVIFDGGSV
jgi:hypothetical protein